MSQPKFNLCISNMTKILIFVGIVAIYFQRTNACNGYNLKLNYLKTCYDESVVKIGKGFDVTMDKDCNLRVSGCLNFTKPITSAKGKYTLNKSPMPPLIGDIDLCSAVEANQIPQITQAVTIIGIKPPKCPVEPNMYCASSEEKMSIAKVKNQLGFAAGKTEVTLDVKHNDEGRTCVKFGFNINKK